MWAIKSNDFQYFTKHRQCRAIGSAIALNPGAVAYAETSQRSPDGPRDHQALQVPLGAERSPHEDDEPALEHDGPCPLAHPVTVTSVSAAADELCRLVILK